MPTQTSRASHNLPRFEDAEPLGPQDAEFTRDIKAVLEKHGNLDRFGLVLLHDHFSVDSDEVAVETNDPQARTLHVEVEKKERPRTPGHRSGGSSRTPRKRPPHRATAPPTRC